MPLLVIVLTMSERLSKSKLTRYRFGRETGHVMCSYALHRDGPDARRTGDLYSGPGGE